MNKIHPTTFPRFSGRMVVWGCFVSALWSFPLYAQDRATANESVPSVPSVAGAPTPEAPPDNAADAKDQNVVQVATPPPAAISSSLLTGWRAHGFVDTYYSFNFNRPASRRNQLRNFDVQSHELTLNIMEIVLEKPVTEHTRTGFRFDFNLGPATSLMHSADPGRNEISKHIQQAYATFALLPGRNLSVDAGIFVTPLGNEVIETADNRNYSRSLLFAYAIPYYHAGVRVQYAASPSIGASMYLVNGWNNMRDNNRGKTFALQATIQPASPVKIIQTYMTGTEQTGQGSLRHVFNTILAARISPTVDFSIDGVYGWERYQNGRVSWYGLAGYLTVAPSERWSFSPRLEWFEDRSGFTTGVSQRLMEFTLTQDVRPHPHFLFRLEYRMDLSTVPFFESVPSRPLARHQRTLLAGMVFTLGK
ncbi:MAG: porin [candidate division Zixibacteria bacterium]|nr:porin [candidate division Zixibacteria bacterium]